jgi:hypothetical protein
MVSGRMWPAVRQSGHANVQCYNGSLRSSVKVAETSKPVETDFQNYVQNSSGIHPLFSGTAAEAWRGLNLLSPSPRLAVSVCSAACHD